MYIGMYLDDGHPEHGVPEDGSDQFVHLQK
jgi:hypothetical protein